MLDVFIDIIVYVFSAFFILAGIAFAFSIVCVFLSMLGLHQFDPFWTFFADGEDDSYGG